MLFYKEEMDPRRQHEFSPEAWEAMKVKTGFQFIASPKIEIDHVVPGEMFLTYPQIAEKKRLKEVKMRPVIPVTTDSKNGLFDTNINVFSTREEFYTRLTPLQCIREAINSLALHHPELASQKAQSRSVKTMTTKEINDYLNSRVLYQKNAVKAIADAIDNALSLPLFDENKPQVITLTGTTGVGKTQLVKELRTLLRMDDNDYNRLAYIEYRCGQMDKEFLEIAIKGIVPTINMSESQCNARVESLYAKVNKATNHYKLDGKKLLLDEDRHFILLFLDEVDKADKELLNALNSLLSDGKIDGRSGSQYKIPDDTRMIVVMTANFGSDEIVSNRLSSLHHPDVVLKVTTQDMMKKGYKAWDISRMGTIVPCLPPTKDDLVVVLIRKVLDYITTPNAFTLKYKTEPKFLNNDMISFVEYIIDRCNPYDGIRNASMVLNEILNAFTKRNLDHCDNYITTVQQKEEFITNRPLIRFECVTLPVQATLDNVLKLQCMKSHRSDDLSRDYVKLALDNKTPLVLLSLEHNTVLGEQDASISVLKPNVRTENKPKLSMLEQLEEYKRVLDHIEEFCTVYEDNNTLAKGILSFMYKETDSLFKVQLDQPKQRRFVSKPDVEHLMQKLTIDTTHDTKSSSISSEKSDDDERNSDDCNNMIMDHNRSKPQRGTKRKVDSETSRTCNICLKSFEIAMFIRSDMKTGRQCLDCRNDRNNTLKREKRKVSVKHANK
jgi:hypothetical protein